MRGSFQYLLVRQDEGVLTITMNRPEVLNAFNDLMLEELTEAVESAARDDAVRCVIIAGAGRAFGSGQDLSVLASAHSAAEPVKVSTHLQKYHHLVQVLHEMPKPVIAAMQGVAAGISLNIALACDLRIASDEARFRQAFARIGLVPDGGGAYFLPRLVGLGKALEMALLADDMNAQEAERYGLVNACVPLAELEAATRTLARRLANGPTRAYGLIKELLYTAVDSDLPTVFALEGKLQDIAIETADHREGVAAFLQKRPPNYSGQ